MQTINITAFTEDSDQINAIKSVLKALKIKFELTKNTAFTDTKKLSKINKNVQVKKSVKDVKK